MTASELFGPAGLWLAAAAALLTLLLLWWLAGVVRRVRAWWYRRLGRRGEDLARKLLGRAGYRILDVQAERRARYRVDGETIAYTVRADFIVEKDGRRYVAEAKNGEQAADPRTRATRRQLLEYSVVFDCAGVLLVDVPGRRVRLVEFS